MKKYLLATVLALFVCAFAYAQSSNVIEAELQNILNQKSDEMIDINIIFKSQINSKTLETKTRRTTNKAHRRELVISELKEFSAMNQADVMSILQSEEMNGNVADINAFWITNTINCKATRDVIYKLSTHPDIMSIGYNKEIQLIDKNKSIETKDIPETRGGSPAQHVQQVKANSVWNQGYTGKNVIVAVLDSGTNTEHYDLKDHLWIGYADTDNDGEKDDIIHGWNYISKNSDIKDDYGHGTHCAGIVCGDGTVGNTVGIAPDATLMTLKIANRTGGGSPANMIDGVQFAIENGANVLSLSLGFKVSQVGTAAKESIRQAFVGVFNAGVVACVAAGNDGTNIGVPDNVDFPGSCPPPWLHPDQKDINDGGLSSVICVGSVNSYNNHVSTSSEGPVTWQDTEYNDYPYDGTTKFGLIRPDISAPGDLIFSLKHDESDKYKLMSGTSQATPCVAGVIALMLEKNPNLTPAEICEIIETTASNQPTTKNNQIGSGVVDALNAVNSITDVVERPYVRVTRTSPKSMTTGIGKTINITLINDGNGESKNTSATLTTNDTYITVVSPTISLGDIDTKSTKDINFNINVADETPNGHTANFTLTTTSGSSSWTDNFSVKIESYAKIIYQSSSTGIINAGEEIQLDVNMINKGTVATTQNSDIKLSSNSSFINIIDGDETFGVMDVNEEKTASFKVYVEPTTPDNVSIRLDLHANPNNNLVAKNITYEFEVELDEYGYPTDGFNGWTTFDNSPDGRNHPWWHSKESLSHQLASPGNCHSGNGQMMSETYCQGSMIEYSIPIDNFLVSPKIKATSNSKISFFAHAHSGNPKERFAVTVSEAGNSSAEDFTDELYVQTIKGSGYQNWKEHTVDLSKYAGKEIYVAIRHYFNKVQWANNDNGFDTYILYIDDVTFHNVIDYSDELKNNNTSAFNISVKSNPLPAPANLTATAKDKSTINLTWDAVTNAQSYNIYRDGSYIRNVSETSFSNTDLNPNTTYCYEVAAVYNNKEYQHSESACAKTEKTDYSFAINTLSPETVYPGTNTIRLTLINDGLIEHETRSTVTLASDNQYVTVAEQGTGQSITALSPDVVSKELSFDVTIDENTPHGEKVDFVLNVTYMYSPYSSFDIPFTINIINELEVPNNIKAQNIDDASIKITWDKAFKAEKYNIYRNGVLAASTTETQYTDENLYHNTEYCYTVTSVLEDTESEHSETACASTPQKERFIAVKEISSDNISIGKSNNVTVTLCNEGNKAADNTVVTLSSSNPNIVVNNNDINLGTMAAGAVATATFNVTVGTSVTENDILDFEVQASYKTSGASTGTKTYSFNDDLENWTVLNVNGDDHTWFHSSSASAHGMSTTEKCLINSSYCSKHKVSIYPDDYIVSPFKVKIGSNTSVSFKARSMASSASYMNEKYSISISEADEPTAESFIDIQSWKMEKISKEKQWTQRDVWLADNYAGKDIWIAIRHHDCGDGQALAIDEITFYNYALETTGGNSCSFAMTATAATNTFIADGDWNDASNWSEGALPENEKVIIEAAVVINGDIVANEIQILRNGYASLTINSGASLTANSISNNNPAALIIKDGAQIFLKNEVTATFSMNIENPTEWSNENKTGWQFISSPITEAYTDDFIPQNSEYDLFKYDGTQKKQWVNHKDASNVFEESFQQGRGYLASYEKNKTSDFKGTVNHSSSFEYNVTYNANDHYANFHLLGNPFSFDMNWDDVATSKLASGYVTVTSDGSYQYHADGVIKVGDGFFVKATGENPSASYGMRSRNNNIQNDYINVIASGKEGDDNLIIKMDDNREGFPKMENFNENIASIFVMKDEQRYGIYNCNSDVKEVELVFEAKQMGNYNISIETEGDYDYVILVDRKTGIETNMLLDSYSFSATSQDSYNRFMLKFANRQQTTDNDNFVYQSGDELIFNAEGSVQIIDMLGKVVFSGEITSENSSINVGNLKKSTYIVNFVKNTCVLSQKVILL